MSSEFDRNAEPYLTWFKSRIAAQKGNVKNAVGELLLHADDTDNAFMRSTGVYGIVKLTKTGLLFVQFDNNPLHFTIPTQDESLPERDPRRGTVHVTSNADGNIYQFYSLPTLAKVNVSKAGKEGVRTTAHWNFSSAPTGAEPAPGHGGPKKTAHWNFSSAPTGTPPAGDEKNTVQSKGFRFKEAKGAPQGSWRGGRKTRRRRRKTVRSISRRFLRSYHK
jgi:hypothetical protein